MTETVAYFDLNSVQLSKHESKDKIRGTLVTAKEMILLLNPKTVTVASVFFVEMPGQQDVIATCTCNVCQHFILKHLCFLVFLLRWKTHQHPTLCSSSSFFVNPSTFNHCFSLPHSLFLFKVFSQAELTGSKHNVLALFKITQTGRGGSKPPRWTGSRLQCLV